MVTNSILVFLGNFHTVFIVAIPVTFPPNSVESFLFSTPSPAFTVVDFLMISNYITTYHLICISAMGQLGSYQYSFIIYKLSINIFINKEFSYYSFMLDPKKFSYSIIEQKYFNPLNKHCQVISKSLVPVYICQQQYKQKKFFWLYHMACGILVPRLRTELMPSLVKVQSPNHQTTREFSK